MKGKEAVFGLECESMRGQGHSRAKESISLTHTLRDTPGLQATRLSTSSLEKKSCAFVPLFLALKIIQKYFAMLAALCSASFDSHWQKCKAACYVLFGFKL